MATGMHGEFRPGSATVPATKVEISVSCRNLLDKDVMSKSDPMCVLYMTALGSTNFAEYERTEMIKNNLNPDFVHKFILNYYFEELQRLKFEVYDVDSPKSALTAHDFLGGLECSLGEILGSPNQRLEKPLRGPSKNSGKIILSGEELSDCKDVFTMQFKGTKLDKKDFFGKSDPYLVFHRCNEDMTYTLCHKTEVIKNNLNPVWKPFKLSVRALCNGDLDRTIKVECFDWNSDGSSDFIGEFKTNGRQLSEGPGSANHYELINPKKKSKKKSYRNSGTIDMLQCNVEKVHSFLDFIRGGTQINFTVAIDFTASNGNPSQPTSLHYINPYQPNQYAKALQAVGEIIQDYDSDKMFPALGFGARVPPDGRVSHEFFLNGHPNNPFCAGIEGVMQAYQQSIRSVQLYGPTNFAPIVNHVARFAAAYPDGSNYFILLIITDGIISDMDQTKAAIVSASSLPMSIIIVGVGPADFSAMEELDADKTRLSSRGQYAERDIVQFVPFREYLSAGSNAMLSQARLAKEVLAEVPDQLLLWMKARGINPKEGPPQQHTPIGQAVPTQQQQPPPPQPQQYNQQQQFPQQHQQSFSQHQFPQQQQQQQPYQQSHQAPYPQGHQAPYPQGHQAPYPQGHQAPYPQGNQAPYPQGNQPPYPQGQHQFAQQQQQQMIVPQQQSITPKRTAPLPPPTTATAPPPPFAPAT
ncbi:copine-8-like isoform X2 [Ptychodera flava]|uniref:copine-8-like isoform X2 n=1 Tax=Ptychodera flava TaxID=63121 RepID=UPI00396A1DF5